MYGLLPFRQSVAHYWRGKSAGLAAIPSHAPERDLGRRLHGFASPLGATKLTVEGRVSRKVVMAVAGLALVAASQGAFGESQAYGVPFVPRASNTAQQGFVRLVNLSESAGDVRITAIDDAGRRFPEIRIALEALATVHFNSEDLEHGNERKGLSRGVGTGTGDWRLEVEADFAFEALGACAVGRLAVVRGA